MAQTTNLDLASLSPIFIVPANLPPDEMHGAEDAILEAGGHLSYEPKEARIFLGRLTQKKRAGFELRSRGVWTEEKSLQEAHVSKKRKLDQDARQARRGSSTIDGENEVFHTPSQQLVPSSPIPLADLNDYVVVLKLDWLYKSLKAGTLLPYQAFLVYSGRIIDKPAVSLESSSQTTAITFIKAMPDTTVSSENDPNPSLVLQSSSSTSTVIPVTTSTSQALPTMTYSPRRFRDQKNGRSTLTTLASHPALHRTTTSEHDFFTSTDKPSKLPPAPSWMLEPQTRSNYACLRSTSMNPVNKVFLEHLYKIKEARLLTLDEIGVRAYSTSIASLSAYDHKITTPVEITRLPGCSDKIAGLWTEWYTSADPSAPDAQRSLSVTSALDKDADLKHLRLFWNIWGVGAETARKFYFEHGWRDLDDVVEFGWHSGVLNRVQQIGVKFYDEFLVKIARPEVEQIADTVLRHARSCRGIPVACWSNRENKHRGNWTKPDDGRGDANWDPRDMVCVIVGGYRRGKTLCGDVDVILSHRDETLTKDLVIDVVRSLEAENYITHTLTLHTTTSDREQQTLPYRDGHRGHGFDSLDKALCVWQDPAFDQTKHDKNPNIHRRVDIIVSPWRTVGAAVLGWSGATTFERDIRRWCRKEKGWKFDSSGVRHRGNGEVFDFERPRNGKQKEGGVVDADEGDGWEDRERRLMEGLGIGWRPAVERCTG